MSDQIKQPIRTQPFLDEKGQLTQRNLELMRNLVQLDILQGAGSPDGVIEAKQRRLYMDTTPAASPVLYIKQQADIAGNRTLGWVGV